MRSHLRPPSLSRRGREPTRGRGRDRDARVGPDTFERRMRESDGPVDLGHYACACGFQFTARVATDVSCPHCGADQAW